MSYNADICKLVIKNVENVEEAQEVLAYADEMLIEKSWQYIGRNIRQQDNLEIGLGKHEQHILRDTSWPRKAAGMPVAYFEFDGEGDRFEDASWITVLCGLAPGTTGGLFFWYEWEVRKRQWQEFLKQFYIKNPGLRESGFSLNADGTAIVFPLKFDLDCLAANFPNLDDCFESLNEALEAIFAQRKTFDKLIKEAGKLGE